MGRVVTEATIENTEDLWAVKKGLVKPKDARKMEVQDALVDTGATLLTLPARLIQQLGLDKTGSTRVNTSLGISKTVTY